MRMSPLAVVLAVLPALALGLIAPSTASAQTAGEFPEPSGATPSAAPAQPPDQQTTFSASTTIVLIPALVATRKGEPVFTLQASDFTVADDGVPQAVRLEEDTGGEPLALVIAIQTGGAGGRRLANYGNLPPLVEAMVGNVEHRIAVVTFDSAPQLAQDFSSDFGQLRQTIHGLSAGREGASILDALAFSVDLLRQQPASYRRAILLISETVDHGSKVRLNEALRSISDTNTAIYPLAFSSTRADLKHEASQFSSNTPGPPGGCMSRPRKDDANSDAASDDDSGKSSGKDTDTDADPDPTDSRLSQAWNCLSLLAPPLRLAKMAALAAMNGLQRNVPETIASLTGGEYFHAENARSLERGLLTLANHLPNRYILSFHPQSPREGLHVLQVRLKDYPQLVIDARSSYWADSLSQTAAHP